MILLLAGSGLHWVPCSILDMLGQGLITLSKNCPSVGGVWTPAGRTSVQLANFRGSSMFYPTKSGHPKNAKKKDELKPIRGASLKRQEQLCQVRSRPGSGFILFFWQNPLVRLTRSPFCWFNRSIPISAGKIPTCGTSGLKTNRVFIVKNHAACCCI